MLRATNKLLQNETMRVLPIRFFSQQTTSRIVKPQTTAKINENVPGLSENCVVIPKQPIGPNAAKDKEYKNPEYFCYDVDSYAEAEVELAKFRLPAPSNKKKFGQ